MRYVIDMDGTICEQPTRGEYADARPLPSIITRIRNLHAAGHHIAIWTARGTTTGRDWRELTEGQLREWGVPYHELMFGKPEADYYVDDRAVNISDWYDPSIPLMELSGLARECAHLMPRINAAGGILKDTLLSGKKVLVCGNGGSAAQAQHFAAELVGRYRSERQPYPAIALTTDTSILTAIANDYGYDEVFSRQVDALGSPGDMLIGLSTSGQSESVLAALRVARKASLSTVMLTGLTPDGEADDCNVVIGVPSICTPRVQEIHTAILHVLCEVMEEAHAAR
jgi:D-sedoheptulose 7-phosphate isomerase